MKLIGDALETARRRFLQTNGSYYDRLMKSSARSVQTWLDVNKNSAIHEAVEHAARQHRIEQQETKDELVSSMRIRILAGMIHHPVEYDDSDIEGGHCAHLVIDEAGYEYCKVPENQAGADAYHAKWGHGPSCPFRKVPNERKSEEKSSSYIDLDDEEDLEEAFRRLDIGRIKGI